MSPDGTTALHIVNHDLSAENVDRTLRFLRARLRFHAANLPPQCAQAVFVDDRGQDVPAEFYQRIRAALTPVCSSVRFAEGA